MVSPRKIIILLVAFCIPQPCELPGNELLRGYRPPQWNQSSALHDLEMLDAERGVAVGDHGLILVTENGGRSWKQVYSGVSCELYAVEFVDSTRGWIVGGAVLPSIEQRSDGQGYNVSRQSVGVVLTTGDGGQSWKIVTSTALPLVTDIQMSDRFRGIAVGLGNQLQPSGVFETADGGLSWSSPTTEQPHGWRSLAADRDRSIAVGLNSEFAEILPGRLRPAATNVRYQPMINEVHLDEQGRGLAIGNQGLLMQSDNLRAEWTRVEQSSLPAHVDLQAIATIEDEVFLAGSPGTHVFRWNRKTEKIQQLPTGQHWPIKRLHFIDSQRGWAIGSLGRILATKDGGKSWQIQRDPPVANRPEGQRLDNRSQPAATLGAMCVVNDPQQIPLELLGRYSAEDGLVTAVVVVGTRERFAPLAAHHATSRLGNSELIWLDPSNLATTVASNQALESSTSNQRQAWVESALGNLIRSFRPQSIVTADQRELGVRQGVDLGAAVASATRWAGQSERAGQSETGSSLPAWRVPRVYKRIDRPDLATIFVAETQYLPTHGSLLADYIAPSRAILGSSVVSRSDTALLIVDANGTAAVESKSLFDPASPNLLRRKQSPGTGRIDSMQTAMKKQQILRDLATWGVFPKANTDAMATAQHQRTWKLKLEKMLAGLDSQHAGLWLYQLAMISWEQGDDVTYEKTLELLASRFPEHFLAERSLLNLLRFRASGESYLARQHRWQAISTTSSPPASKVRQVDYQATQQITQIGNTTRIEFKPPNQSSASEPNSGPLEIDEAGQLGAAKQLSNWINARQVSLASDPAFSMQRASLNRKTSELTANRDVWFQLTRSPFASPLQQFVAQREYHLLDPAKEAKDAALVHSQIADAMPVLDGRLDETFWQSATVELHSQPASKLWIAHDSHYLYIAARCEKHSRCRYTASELLRERDTDLTAVDHFRIRLDTDRDYRSWFELAIDHRGWANDELVMGHAHGVNPHWDPRWFIAHSDDDRSWTIEAAIPLDQLVTEKTLASAQRRGDRSMIWAVSVDRSIPCVDGTTESSRWPQVSRPADLMPLGLIQLNLPRQSDPLSGRELAADQN